MIIPAAETIEMGVDSLIRLDQAHKDAQLKELRCAIGNERSPLQFEDGYLLGLQTARVFLSGNPAAVLAKVSF